MKKLVQTLLFRYPANMNSRDRFMRLGAGLISPTLSLTGVIDGTLDKFLAAGSIVILLTGITGKCFFYHLTGRCSIKDLNSEQKEKN